MVPRRAAVLRVGERERREVTADANAQLVFFLCVHSHIKFGLVHRQSFLFDRSHGTRQNAEEIAQSLHTRMARISEPVYDLQTGELCNLTVPGPLPEGWHAVLDRRCGPTGQLLFYNEETEELLTTMPGAAAAEQKRLLAAEFARTRGDLEGFLAGAAQAQTSALLQKIERLEQMQRDRNRTDRLRFELEQDVRSSGVEGGWNGYNALVQGVKRAARSHPLGNRQKVQTAEVTRMEYERYVALHSMWQYMYCGLCLMCVTVVVLLLASVNIARRL